jgi:hypothetical protein
MAHRCSYVRQNVAVTIGAVLFVIFFFSSFLRFPLRLLAIEDGI